MLSWDPLLPGLMLAAFAGAALNSVAGGGSFLTFPALLWAGLGPIAANATSTVALWPGSLGSAWGYRADMAGVRRWLLPLGLVSAVGGWIGAQLLLVTGDVTFAQLIPVLLGGATLLLALQGTPLLRPKSADQGHVAPLGEVANQGVVARRGAAGPEKSRLRPKSEGQPWRSRGAGALAAHKAGARGQVFRGHSLTPELEPRPAPLPVLMLAQGAIAIYGGFFGGGIGILMLAAFAFMGLRDLHAANGLKSVLGAGINGVAVVVLTLGGQVDWRRALPMVLASWAGGYWGARLARRVPAQFLRRGVVVVGTLLTVWFAVQGFTARMT